jgi:cation:H+ antiporter
MAIIFFILGLGFLVIGADVLIRGASRLALTFGIAPLVIGLTVVAFGTSAPELAVSVQAAISNQANLALGNVVGSNIFNILFILGVSSLIAPLIVAKNLIRRDVPIMIGISVVVYLFALNYFFSFTEGLILFISLIIYLWFLIYQSRRENSKNKEDEKNTVEVEKTSFFGHFKNIGFIILGLGLLILGSNWLVDSSVIFAKYLGVSELVIGLTIVAIGTSLPEVVTSIVATIRGERDIAVGNVIGSNIFNILGVVGFAGIFSPNGIAVAPSMINFDLPFMIAVALICLPIFITGGTISRLEGLLLFTIYVVYTVHLILTASNSSALPVLNSFILYLLAPITCLLIIFFYIKGRMIKKQGTS